MSLRSRAGVVATAITSFSLSFALTWSGWSGSAAELAVQRTDLQGADAIVAGTVDATGTAWVLARQRTAEAMVLYRVSSDGGVRRSAVPLSAAASLGAITAGADGSIWVGAGQALARIDASTGRPTRSIELSSPTASVSTATRAPDGTVLGWGQVTGLAVDASGAAWVARYAVPSLARATADGSIELVALPDTDADRLIATPTLVWFTTNYGPGQELGARIGVIAPATRTVSLIGVVAAVVVSTARGVEAIGADRTVIDPVTRRTSKGGSLPREALSLGAVGADSAGNLVARIAQKTRLLFFDERGRPVRTIDYDGGSFQTRGRELATVAPLALLAATPTGVWFAARGGSAVYFAR